MDFSDFLTMDNLIFFGVIIAVLALFLAICFVVIRVIFRFVISLFKRKPKEHTMEGASADKGEDLGVYVKELEKSKREGIKIQSLKQSAPTLKYDQPTSKRESKKEIKDGGKQDWVGKEQKDIEEGLNKLKGIKTEENSFLKRQTSSEKNEDEHQKIKIPVAKKFGNISEVDEQDSLKLEEKDQILVPKRPSIIKKNNSKPKLDEGSLPKNLEKLSEIRSSQKKSANGQKTKEKILESGVAKRLREESKWNRAKRIKEINTKGKLPHNLEDITKARGFDKKFITNKKEEDSFFEKPNFLEEEFAKSRPLDKKSNIGTKKSVSSDQKDGAIFNGKQEITRRQLKYKLWKDPKVYKAARESLLNFSPMERANLEKKLFPGAYGLNISKSDIKTRMRKLSQEMLNEKRPQVKSTLRKEIKFIKKISGIK
jgi:hypothetical protein